MTWGTDCPQCGKDDCKWVRGSICDGNVEQQFATLQRELEAVRAALGALHDAVRDGDFLNEPMLQARVALSRPVQQPAALPTSGDGGVG